MKSLSDSPLSLITISSYAVLTSLENSSCCFCKRSKFCLNSSYPYGCAICISNAYLDLNLDIISSRDDVSSMLGLKSEIKFEFIPNFSAKCSICSSLASIVDRSVIHKDCLSRSRVYLSFLQLYQFSKSFIESSIR